MKKIICISEINDIFCKIKYIDNKLSISGVIKPSKNGNAESCGQINNTIKEYYLNDLSLDKKTVIKFLNIWDKYHLNDMKPNCEHQKGKDWNPSKDISIFRFTLKKEIKHKINITLEKMKQCLKDGKTFKPSKEQTLFSNLKTDIKHHDKNLPVELSKYYDKHHKKYDWQKDFEEVKKTGWTNEKEHPQGILSKPCNVCGYKYGTAWKTLQIPKNAITFLKNIPSSTINPIWI